MLKFRNSTTGNKTPYTLHAKQFPVSFHFALRVALLVGCSTKHFL